MDTEASAPLSKLKRFKTLIGLDGPYFGAIEPFKDSLVNRSKLFARDFSEYIQTIPEISIYLEHQKYPGHLEEAWSRWFELLFKEAFSEQFLLYQWRTGLRHVQVGVDHRFVMLGYSFLRQFCQQSIGVEALPSERANLLLLIDRIVDFCLLVETQAFVEATARCDIEIVKGISHQVRNPLTVIGGNVARLKRKSAPDDPVRATYDTLYTESKRLEAMVDDAATYSAMFQKDTRFSRVKLPELVAQVIRELREKEVTGEVDLTVDFDVDMPEVLVDKEDIQIMFLHVLLHAIESSDPARQSVNVLSRSQGKKLDFVEVEVVSTGLIPSTEELESLFLPFSSTKPKGTGFGLAIARLAARRSLGDVFIAPALLKGMKTVVKLPAA
jgi:signal transduction histidine kinase